MTPRADRNRALYARRRAAGLCVRCGVPSAGARCAGCLGALRDAARDRYDTRVASGQCVGCGAACGVRARCRACREEQREPAKARSARWREAHPEAPRWDGIRVPEARP